jgi:hypothetical protein
MSKEAIQDLIGHAIIDKDFMHDLLNSRRREVIARFELSPEEEYVLNNIEADTLEQFALQIDNWLTYKEQVTISLPVLSSKESAITLSTVSQS